MQMFWTVLKDICDRNENIIIRLTKCSCYYVFPLPHALIIVEFVIAYLQYTVLPVKYQRFSSHHSEWTKNKLRF